MENFSQPQPRERSSQPIEALSLFEQKVIVPNLTATGCFEHISGKVASHLPAFPIKGKACLAHRWTQKGYVIRPLKSGDVGSMELAEAVHKVGKGANGVTVTHKQARRVFP